MTTEYIINFFFFFNDTATTEIYTLSLHDALPIFADETHQRDLRGGHADARVALDGAARSEEHTSELQSQSNLVCRLLLEKKKTYNNESISIEGIYPKVYISAGALVYHLIQYDSYG